MTYDTEIQLFWWNWMTVFQNLHQLYINLKFVMFKTRVKHSTWHSLHRFWKYELGSFLLLILENVSHVDKHHERRMPVTLYTRKEAVPQIQGQRFLKNNSERISCPFKPYLIFFNFLQFVALICAKQMVTVLIIISFEIRNPKVPAQLRYLQLWPMRPL